MRDDDDKAMRRVLNRREVTCRCRGRRVRAEPAAGRPGAGRVAGGNIRSQRT